MLCRRGSHSLLQTTTLSRPRIAHAWRCGAAHYTVSPAAAAASLSPVAAAKDDAVVSSTRNIGIVAHIDAGKTTTTERMLFYAGVVRRIGDVDAGTTTTDYMPEEMERGITIQSAAVSLQWRAHAINLIDTPGHVDFTVEVERAMRVVDGVVALFDAAVGVQAQSYTVLQQSRKFGVPVLAFMNKMDKHNANFDQAVASLQHKLRVQPLLLQRPLLAADGSFEGVIDVAAQTTQRFGGEHGACVDVRDLLQHPQSEDAHVVQLARAARHTLLAQLTSLDDALAEAMIAAIDDAGGDEAAAERRLSPQAVRDAVRRVLLRPYTTRHKADNKDDDTAAADDDDEDASSTTMRMVVPVLCGAARRDQGVQPLLDAVVDYLPSPRDRVLHGYNAAGALVPLPAVSAATTAPVLALVFKVTHMPGPQGRRQALVFLRVYSGKLTPRMTLHNRTRGGSSSSNNNMMQEQDGRGNNSSSSNSSSGGGGARSVTMAAVAAAAAAAAARSSAAATTERIDKLYVMHADRPVEVPYLLAGQIGAAFMQHACTGDTLYAAPPLAAARSWRTASSQQQQHDNDSDDTATRHGEVHTLEGIDAPPPVISFSLEPATRHDADALHGALGELTREDPSLHVRRDDDGHVVVRGMGELHLDVALSRLRREHGVNCRLLRAVIEYRETVTCVHEAPQCVGLHNGMPYVECTLQLRPRLRDDGAVCDVRDGCAFVIDEALRARYVQHHNTGGSSSSMSSSSPLAQQQQRMNDVRNAKDELRCLETCFGEAVAACARLGPRSGAPLHGMHVVLMHVQKAAGVELQERALAPAARAVVLQALHSVAADTFALLEPTMEVDVCVSEAAYVGGVVSSLNQQHALCVDVLEDEHTVRALVALRNCVRYTTELRKVVKGHASLQMRLHHYRVVDDAAVLERILRNRGVTTKA